jgi:hypothetical protein
MAPFPVNVDSAGEQAAADAGATDPPTGTTDGISASRNTVKDPSPNFSRFLTVFRV